MNGKKESKTEWERKGAKTFSSQNIQNIKIRENFESSSKNLNKMVFMWNGYKTKMPSMDKLNLNMKNCYKTNFSERKAFFSSYSCCEKNMEKENGKSILLVISTVDH